MNLIIKWFKTAIIILVGLTLMQFIFNLISLSDGIFILKDIPNVTDIILSIVFSFIFVYEPIKKIFKKPLFKSNKK